MKQSAGESTRRRTRHIPSPGTKHRQREGYEGPVQERREAKPLAEINLHELGLRSGVIFVILMALILRGNYTIV